MIETKQLQYFLKCAEFGAFSKAAEELYTTQPNVSKVIKSLEEEIGIELFERQNNGILLNETGELIYQYAKDAMNNVKKISEFAKQLKAKDE